MTPLQQRGHDDALAGKIDEALASADSQEGREYREGKRRAQWAQQDAAEGVVHVQAQRTAVLEIEPSTPPEMALSDPDPSAPTSLPTVAPGGAAFFDPPPAAEKKRKAKADRDAAQLDLFG